MLRVNEAYEECRLITKREAKNFFYAFITLPPQKRRAIYAAYAFCRHCDDAVDMDMAQDEKLRALDSLKGSLTASYQARPQGTVFTALAHAAETYQIPQQHFQDVINGVEMDLVKDRYQTFEELRLYCYRVASAVGLICLEIFGYKDPKAREYAVDLGLAMQLTNILRDVEEDMARDRIYIPQEDLERFGYSEEELRQGVVNDTQRNLMEFQVQRARGYFKTGIKLMPYLPPRSRACPAVLAQLYSHILDRIEARDYNIFNGRISLSGREKLLVTATTWLKSFLPHPIPNSR
jgi:phytoene synthase